MAGRTWLTVVSAAALALALPATAPAHPAPFSYLDIVVERDGLRLSLAIHTFDIAHEVQIDPPERVLEAETLRAKGPQFASMLAPRLTLTVDGATLPPLAWSNPEAMPERQSVRLEATVKLERAPGRIGLRAHLFPYDKVHQTFVNVYEGDAIATQAILDVRRQTFGYYASTPRGLLAVIATFVPDGLTHTLFGPDHLIFLVGLMLLGGTLRQRLLVVSAFTLTHTVALFLGAFNVVRPPARWVDPAIALSIVYVGADNLMVRGGRDVRGWIASAFGAIHGLGFAPVLHGFDLSRVAMACSVVSFNVGIGLGHVLVVSAVATVVMALRSRDEALGRRVAYAGSLVVIAAGTFWFVQRVFFPGGTV